MERIKEEFLDKLESVISLRGKDVLEIGCGEGTRSIEIAGLCKSLTAIDPDPELISKAGTESHRDNISYVVASAEQLPFSEGLFDLVVFTLSFHHVPKDKMAIAIDESLRVLRRDGYIVFLEPEFNGSLFESEIMFEAFDGDERKMKALAYFVMLDHQKLKEVAEIADETIWKLESVEDYIEAMKPKKNLDKLEQFLRDKNFMLRASRRINIFKPAKPVLTS